KIAGGWNLHQASRGMELDFFVLFSSVTSLLGSPGQGNYAAANAYLDALAAHRQSSGLPGLSLNWGAWAGGGMAAQQTVGRRLAARGLTPLGPERALEIFGHAIRERAAGSLAVLAVDWARFLEGFAEGSEPPIVRELAADRPRSSEDLRKRLLEAPARRR